MAARKKKAASPYADGRGSAVDPDLDAAMAGKGGKRPPKPKPKPKTKQTRKRPPTRAEEMDKGLRLKPVAKKKARKKK